MISLSSPPPPEATPTAAAGMASWSLGHLTISLGQQGRDLPPPGSAQLLIPTAQPLTVQQRNLERILRPRQDLLYLPAGGGAPLLCPFQGWRLTLNLERLIQLAAQLADHRLSPGRFRRTLQHWRPLQLRLSPERELGASLLQLLQLSEAPALQQHHAFELIGLDAAIERLVVVLLCGEMIQAAQNQSAPEAGSKVRIFEELLNWIKANLHRPLHMQDLVNQSGYSQRSLRNFFQERCGCVPVQWIRQQRLDGARQRLLNPEPQDTVSSIAAEFGYAYLSQFSRDFQGAYQCRPSEVLREGQRGLCLR
jgi:AraC-like DNA-binding protein